MDTEKHVTGAVCRKSYMTWLVVSVLFVLQACSHVGPRSIQQDRFDYNGMVARSWQEQTLLNIVKTRYYDVPVFLDVAQIVGGYTLESSISLGGVDILDAPGDSFNMGLNGKWTDRPTITYRPLTGTQFNRSLLTPIPPMVVLFMAQSGWNVSKIFKLTVESINGIKSLGENQESFLRLISLMNDLQKKKYVNMRIENKEDGRPDVIMLFRDSSADGENRAKSEEIRKILGLKPNQEEFIVTYGPINTGDNHIAMQTRSLMQILVMLSSQIDISEQELAEGRAVRVPEAYNILFDDFRIHQGTEKPKNSLVAVLYRDRWFWIDDRDLDSKLVFALIMILNTQMESGGVDTIPLVTIPAG